MNQNAKRDEPGSDRYGVIYDHFASDICGEVRRETYGEDIAQTGWLSVEEHDAFTRWLAVGRDSVVLDVACGAGGPTVRMVEQYRCNAVGVDIHERAVLLGRRLAASRGVEALVRFEILDASRPFPYADRSFDAIMCIDGINHLPNRWRLMSEWARLLKPGGRLLFTDPLTVTGHLSNHEIAVRSSMGFFLFVPLGVDEEMIKEAGLNIVAKEDGTGSMARIARRWMASRASREAALREMEGNATFDMWEEFLHVAAETAEERRLCRMIYVSEKPLEHDGRPAPPSHGVPRP